MKPYHMVSRHDPANGEYGDCLRACIASLIDAEMIEHVPHFARENPEPNAMWQNVRNWLLDEHNASLWFTPFGGDDWQAVATSCNMLNPGMFYMLQGASAGGDHIVICKGDRLIHDPSRMGGGLIGPGSNGVFMVVLIVSDRLVA